MRAYACPATNPFEPMAFVAPSGAFASYLLLQNMFEFIIHIFLQIISQQAP